MANAVSPIMPKSASLGTHFYGIDLHNCQLGTNMGGNKCDYQETGNFMTEGQLLQLVALIMVLGLVFPGFLYYTRHTSMASVLRNIAIWLALALVAAFLFSIFG